MNGIPVCRRQGDALELRVRVQPRASRNELLFKDGVLKVRITAPPLDGKANEQLIRLLAEQFGVAKSKVTLLRGQSGREKLLLIQSPARIPPPLKEFADGV